MMPNSSLQPLPPIWVINLKRSTARREYIEEHLRSLGLAYELIEAVDGREISDEQVAQLKKEAEKAKMLNVAYNLAKGRVLSKNEMGCSLSHRKCWQRMIDEGIEEVLILEDDIVLTADFVEILKRRHLFPQHWERMNFMIEASIPLYIFGDCLYKNYRLAKAHIRDGRTSCYFLKYSAAQKLLKQNFTAYLSVDWHTGSDFISGCVSGTVSPLSTSLRDVDSDIGYPPDFFDPPPDRYIRRIRNRFLAKSFVRALLLFGMPCFIKSGFTYAYYQKKILKRKAKQDIRFILKQRQGSTKIKV